ncbi:NfeD family protein [Clostridium polynesiense]|uniref:NfeD family protein n=1 Tax=Clostridium polynesiense TaxID=1325933 RepID=UPI00058D981A|nr:NfeD family protein [Clostridium polynesiense]
MRSVYYLFFCIGVVYTIITFVLGGIFDSFDISGEGSFEGVLSSLKPSVIISFCTIFGGIGLMTLNKLPWYLGLSISLLSAFLTAYIINKFIIVPLYKSQNTSAGEKAEFIGREALVISPILEKSYGTISYSYKGNTYTSPAKSIEGERIDQGLTVIIIKIEDNLCYVMQK